LPWRQQNLTQRGHAIECRIYAEDPVRDFLPQAGTLLRYVEPQGPGIRVDAGYAEGNEVSVYYDPLIAKLIVSAETRAAGLRRAVAALREFAVLGIRTNIPFLIAVLQHPRFVAGTVHTGWLDDEADHLRASVAKEEIPIAALAAVIAHQNRANSDTSASGSSTFGTADATDTRIAGDAGASDPAQIDPFTSLGNWRG
jgi:acetyl/propionyl-CoA carboxylase alpha subunit